jgi:hypothetical protein
MLNILILGIKGFMEHCLWENNNLRINNHQVEIQTWLQHATLAIYRLTYRFELTRFGDHQKVVPLKPKNGRWRQKKKTKIKIGFKKQVSHLECYNQPSSIYLNVHVYKVQGYFSYHDKDSPFLNYVCHCIK